MTPTPTKKSKRVKTHSNNLCTRFKDVNKKEKTNSISTDPAITCSKLTIETLEKGVEYVQS